MKLPKRKSVRLNDYDYRSEGIYFITICIKDRKPVLSHIVGATIGRPQSTVLTSLGKTVDEAVQEIPVHYPDIVVEKYVIMPNHVHLLISKCGNYDPDGAGENFLPERSSDMSKIIQQMKGVVTKRCGECIWQKSFYDHIIRDEQDFQTRWRYIDENPVRWQEDELYIDNI